MPRDDQDGGPTSRKDGLLDRPTIAFLILGTAAALALAALEGPSVVVDEASQGLGMILMIVPMILGGLLVGALVQKLVPPQKISRLLGHSSGWRGLTIATLGGMFTPGGPFASFPLVLAIYRAGADVGTTVAYVTAWSMVGINRLIVWELPFLSGELSLTRLAVSLPLPFLAGGLARVVLSALGRHAFEPGPGQ